MRSTYIYEGIIYRKQLREALLVVPPLLRSRVPRSGEESKALFTNIPKK